MDMNIYEGDKVELLDAMQLDPQEAINLCLNCTVEKCKGTCARLESILSKTKKHKNGSAPKTYTYDGKTMTIREWASYLGVTLNAFQMVKHRKKSVIKAIQYYEDLRSAPAQ